MEYSRWEKIKDPYYTVGKNVTIIVRISSIVSNVNIVHDPSAYGPVQEYFTYMETSPLPVKGLQNLGLCSALRTFDYGGIFIVP
jgi:hypothetical protein